MLGATGSEEKVLTPAMTSAPVRCTTDESAGTPRLVRAVAALARSDRLLALASFVARSVVRFVTSASVWVCTTAAPGTDPDVRLPLRLLIAPPTRLDATANQRIPLPISSVCLRIWPLPPWRRWWTPQFPGTTRQRRAGRGYLSWQPRGLIRRL